MLKSVEVGPLEHMMLYVYEGPNSLRLSWARATEFACVILRAELSSELQEQVAPTPLASPSDARPASYW